MARHVVFLCTGNICRSPMAEVIARQKFGHLGLKFSSAALNPLPGHAASRFSQEFVDGLGLTLDNHQSRPLDVSKMGAGDWIIGMTRSHAAICKNRLGSGYSGSIGVLGAPGVDLSRVRHSPEAEEVADPYGMTRDRYFACGQQITRLLEAWEPEFSSLSER